VYQPVRVAAPAILPVTKTEAKAHLDVTYADKDTLIDGLIAAAISRYDGWRGILGICLVEQSWRQDFDSFSRELRLRLGPVISITSVIYDDENGDPQTIAAENYVLANDASGPFVRLVETYSYPTLSSVLPALRVTYKAGHANAGTDPNFTSTVPDGIKIMMLMLIRHWFDNPSGVIVGVTASAAPLSVRALEEQWHRPNV
jgi:uncharacterized phiE125 gp8 family phage protein